MKEGLRRVLGGRAGRVLLGVCAAAAVVVIGCLLGFARPGSRELTEEEPADWQEKLDSPAYRGFLTGMYTDVRYLPLDQLLWEGAGLERTGENYLSAQDLEAYLTRYTGLTLEDFASGLSWAYLAEEDGYCFPGTAALAAPEITVLSGWKKGDTVTLQVDLADESSAAAAAWGIAWEAPTLTLEGERVVSFTTPLYAAVETMAIEYMASAVNAWEVRGVEIESGCIRRLALVCGAEAADDRGTYMAWQLAYRLKPENGEEEALTGAPMEEGWLTEETAAGSPVFLVRVDGEGTVYQEEIVGSADAAEQTETLANYLMACLYGLDCVRWPAEEDLLRDGGTPAGEWALREEGVARGYLLSYGDTLGTWTFCRVPAVQEDTRVIRAVGESGRTYTLLLARITGEDGTSPGWQVLAAAVEGEPLPAQQGSSGRPYTASLTLPDEELSCSLCQGGGAYGLYAWSLYIPDGGWQRDAGSCRWYPLSDRLDMYLEIRTLTADVTAEVFYRSYENQFDETLTNQGQEGVSLPWALGIQGGRRSESLLYLGEQGVWEVLWTYGEGEESWGDLLRAVAETFRPVGDEETWEKGQLRDTMAQVFLAEQEEGGDVPAGTYLVLRSGAAFSLEDCFAPYAREWRDRRNTVSEGYRYGEIRMGEIRLLDTYRRGDDLPVQIFSVDWGIQVEPADDPNLSDGMYIDEDGVWHCGFAVYLAVEHDRNGITRSFVLVPGDSRPGSAAFTGQLVQVLEGRTPEVPVTRHDGQPDARYDEASGGLTAP